MKIKYLKDTKNIKYDKSIITINFYKDDRDICYDSNNNKFLNIKIAKNKNQNVDKITERSLIRILKKSIMDTKKSEAEIVIFDYFQFINLVKENVIFNTETSTYNINNNHDNINDKFIQNITTYILVAAYKFENYKTTKTNNLKEIIIVGDIDKKSLDLLKIGEVYGYSTNISRDMSNTPGNDMTPTILAKQTQDLFANQLKDKNSKLKVKIIDDKQCKKLGMNLFCAVGQGSQEESKLIVIEYMNGEKNQSPIVFVGKGITFDTGGLNVKTQNMQEMIMDMTGGATVISAMKGIVDLNIKKNIIAIVPAVENALSGSSYRPGDIIKSMSGITVEIGNTDAEGRLVMADAITYSENNYTPKVIIDVATLTGASLVALGEKASAIVSFDQGLRDYILNISENNHEYMFALPAWQEYREDIKSNTADIININNKKAFGAGTITAAMFIYEFIDKIKQNRLSKNSKNNELLQWAHIDIAPRMTSNYQDNLESGAVGEPVKTLIDIAKIL